MNDCHRAMIVRRPLLVPCMLRKLAKQVLLNVLNIVFPVSLLGQTLNWSTPLLVQTSEMPDHVCCYSRKAGPVRVAPSHSPKAGFGLIVQTGCSPLPGLITEAEYTIYCQIFARNGQAVKTGAWRSHTVAMIQS